MPNAAPDAANHRTFRVRARDLDVQHAHTVLESSFEAAAIAYMEDFPYEIGKAEEINVIVEEVGSGHTHCFKVDIETGETEPCA